MKPPRAATGPDIDVSILVNTFRKPRHLALVLESIALQRSPGVAFEVVVTDDGSEDATEGVVATFAASVPFPVRFITQPHDGFRLARIRNHAARLARGDYLLFLDGDCMLPAHHLAAHVERRRAGTALLGYCARLPRQISDLLAPENLRYTDLAALVPEAEQRALTRRHRKAWWHNALRHPRKPRLAGGDCGVWRTDFAHVNGFDERFVGWGQEDDDLGLRLRAAGVRLESILDRTCSLHVWHPTDPTAAARWRDGPNVRYFERPGRLVRCRAGLEPRPPASILWGLPADVHDTPLGRRVERLLAGCPQAPPGAACEIDIAIQPGRTGFTRPAECRLLILEGDGLAETPLHGHADRIVPVTADDDRGLGDLLATVG